MAIFANKILVWKPEKRSPGRSMLRRDDNIKMHHLKIGWDGVDWIDLTQDSDR